MRTEHFKYLLEISKTRSINLAAQNLHLTQQSLSRSVKSLEDALGVTLLERNSKGVKFTPQGKIILAYAQEFTERIADMRQELLASSTPTENMRGQLNIMYTNAFDLEKLTLSIQDFRKKYPNVKINIHSRSLHILLNSLLDNSIDIGLISVPGEYHLSQAILGEKLKDIQSVPLYEDTLLAAVSKSSPLCNYKSVSINTLLKQPIVLLLNDTEYDSEKNWLSLLLKQYGQPQYSFVTSVNELYFQSILTNIGIGFFTRSSTTWVSPSIMEGMKIIPIRPPIKLFFSYVLNRNISPSPITQAFLPYLDKYINKFKE